MQLYIYIYMYIYIYIVREREREKAVSNIYIIYIYAYWKESYDQRRQHIKKQRHYFANKSPSSQGYGFSSGRVWM